jgi:hypothetical protein
MLTICDGQCHTVWASVTLPGPVSHCLGQCYTVWASVTRSGPVCQLVVPLGAGACILESLEAARQQVLPGVERTAQR